MPDALAGLSHITWFPYPDQRGFSGTYCPAANTVAGSIPTTMHKDSSSASKLFFRSIFILSFTSRISFWYFRRPVRTDPFLRLAGYPVPSAFSCIRIQAAAPAGQPPVSRPTERCRRRSHPWFFAVLTVAPFFGICAGRFSANFPKIMWRTCANLFFV